MGYSCYLYNEWPFNMQDNRGYTKHKLLIHATCYMLAQADKWRLASSYKQLVKAAIRTLGEKATVIYKAAQTKIEGNAG